MKKIFLIGNPIEHSISPQVQNAALNTLNINARYEAMLVNEADLASTVMRLRDASVIGFNVTVPFKEKVMKLVDNVDASSKIIGAINTVKNNKGKLMGCNTDTIGFSDSLKEDAGFDAKSKRCVILGAGGASRALVFGLNYQKAGKIFVYDIEHGKSTELVKSMSRYFNNIEAIRERDTLMMEISGADLIVNATPAGTYPKIDSSPLGDEAPLHEGQVVYDLVYNPAQTKLAKLARTKGAKAVTGLGMLVRQGAASFEVWTSRPSPYEVMLSAAMKALGQ